MALLKLVSEQKPRQIAAQVLLQRRAGGEFIEDRLQAALAGAALSPADRGLCQELVYGVVRWQATLDRLIARKTDGREQKPALQNLLRLGLYQIFWLDRIPDHAAVHETVELAKQNGFGSQAGFVNAILRGYLREHDETQKLLAGLKVTQPALGWSHPEWLVARWQKRWGAEKTAALLAWNNTPPKTFARVNSLKFGGADGARLWSKTQPQHAGQTGDIGNGRAAAAGAPHTAAPQKMADAGDLLTCWRDENVEYDFVRRDWFEENLAFELKSHPPLTSLKSFQQGWFYVQDPGTLLAPALLGAQPGETILDFCAAPGGKTTFIAQLLNNQGRIVAQDVSEERLKWIQENCTRLGVTCVEAVLPSTLNSLPGQSGATTGQPSPRFDRVLVDAPCSNTGVMRRRVDLRWRIQPKEIERLRAAQLDLLKQAAEWVKPGGVLVYSTCSLEPEENGEVVKEFLSGHADFKLECQRELLPFVDHVDGAYVARMKKE
jgi:16S rRNA (cytosine967-C5)-methyltransferase